MQGQYMLLCFCSSHGSLSLISSSTPPSFPLPLPFFELRSFIPHLSFYSPWNTGDSTRHTLWFSWLLHAEGCVTSFRLHVLKWRLQRLSFPGVPGWAVMKQRPQLFLGQHWVLSWCWVCDWMVNKCQQRYALLNSRESLIPEPTWGKKKPCC